MGSPKSNEIIQREILDDLGVAEQRICEAQQAIRNARQKMWFHGIGRKAKTETTRIEIQLQIILTDGRETPLGRIPSLQEVSQEIREWPPKKLSQGV